ncbi:hypothetical protein E2320_021707 [Naja naja]|nr:hypothetical protein E2320_021707 [Naja naja]
MFSFSRLTWQWSITAEVFSLNNLFVGLLMALSVQFKEATTAKERSKICKVGAFSCGLSMCNQHTIVIYMLCIVLWVSSRLFRERELTLSNALKLSFCFLAGCLPYLYLPISAYLNKARWTWGDQTSFKGFMTHLLREEYGTFSLAKLENGSSTIDVLLFQVTHMKMELSLVVHVFAIVACVCCAAKDKEVTVDLAVYINVIDILFFLCLEGKFGHFKAPVERFWMQSNAVIVVLAGFGFSLLFFVGEIFIGNSRMIYSLEWLLAAVLVTAQIYSNYRLR